LAARRARGGERVRERDRQLRVAGLPRRRSAPRRGRRVDGRRGRCGWCRGRGRAPEHAGIAAAATAAGATGRRHDRDQLQRGRDHRDDGAPARTHDSARRHHVGSRARGSGVAMALRYEWSWRIQSIGTVAIKVTDDGGTSTVSLTSGTYAHTSISSVVPGYTAFSAALKAALDADSTLSGTYTVTWNGTTGYTISVTGSSSLTLSFATTTAAHGTRM